MLTIKLLQRSTGRHTVYRTTWQIQTHELGCEIVTTNIGLRLVKRGMVHIPTQRRKISKAMHQLRMILLMSLNYILNISTEVLSE